MPLFNWIQRLLALVLVGGLGVSLYARPLAVDWLFSGLLIYGFLLWRYPAAWMLVLPCLLPVLDLTPWTGRLHYSEFDLFVVATLVAALWRGALTQYFLLPRGVFWLLSALILVVTAATARGWINGIEAFPGEYSHYLGPFNSLREAKGLLAAMLLFLLLRLEISQRRQVAQWFSAGMIGGLLMVCLAIVWERLLFTGFFDYSQNYRVTALFSSMHLGGAAVDGFLALTLPFVATVFLHTRQRGAQIAALVLFGFAMYAFLVTFSRTNYLALAVMLGVALLGYLYRKRRGHRLDQRSRRVLIAAAAVMALVALPILTGNFAQTRLASVSRDFDTRLDHWSSVLQAMNSSPRAILFGHGIGSFPRDYRSMLLAQGQKPAELSLLHENQTGFIRFTPSDTKGDLFLRQRISLPENGEAVLNLTLRNTTAKPQKLLVEFCEMNILPALPECKWAGFLLQAKSQGQWVDYSRPVHLKRFGRGVFGISRPLDIHILNRGISAPVDIARVELLDDRGRPLLANSNFSNGMDHWFFNSGDHLKWHAKNLFLHVYFETGLAGILTSGALFLLVVLRLVKRTVNGDRYAHVVLVALAGFMVVGLFDSLIDDPRIGLLFFLVLMAGLQPLGPSRNNGSSGIFQARKALITVALAAVSLPVLALLHQQLLGEVSSRALLSASHSADSIKGAPPLPQDRPATVHDFPGPQAWPAQGPRTEGFLAQQYDAQGVPLPVRPSPVSFTLVAGKRLLVSTAAEFATALQQAQPGDQILLTSGTYVIADRIPATGHAGTPAQPIVVTANSYGQARLEIRTPAGIRVNQPYWVFENLVFEGACADQSPCEHAVHISAGADGTVIRNNQFSRFRNTIFVSRDGDGEPAPEHGLISHNALLRHGSGQTGKPAAGVHIAAGSNWVVEANYISDFSAHGAAVFLSGQADQALVERNLILCHGQPSSIGDAKVNGIAVGTGPTCSQDDCAAFHQDAQIRNNIISHCGANDGIALGRALRTRIYNNLLASSRGIGIGEDARDSELFANILEGGIHTTAASNTRQRNNLISPACGFFMSWSGDCDFDDWFAAPDRGDFRLRKLDRILLRGSLDPELETDFCGAPRTPSPDLGPIQYSSGATCLPGSRRTW